MSLNTYIAGDWNVICDRCGLKKKRSATKLTWDNLLVCINKCWEPRQPQDLVRGVKDRQNVPLARPEATDIFLNYGDITPGDL